MKHIGNVILLIFSAVILMMNMNCGDDSLSETNNTDDAVAKIPVEVKYVEKGDISAYYSGSATLEAEEEAQVVSKVQGVVQEISVEEGQYVNEGQKLAQLDAEQLKLELAQTEVNLNKLENNMKRSEELYKKKLISNEEFDQVKYDYKLQKANYDLAKHQVDNSTLRSPISGVISKRFIKIGNMVTPNQVVFQVTDFDPLLAILHIPEKEMSKIKVGQLTELSVDAIPGKNFSGTVKRISPIVDSETGTAKITVEVHDPSQMLKSGMFARVKIIYDVRQNTLLIPKEAVLTEDEESSVYIVSNDSLALRKTVKIGFVNTTRLEILEGLNPGDTIVTTGLNTLKDSTKVEPVNIEELFKKNQ